jgi:pyruvate dehydrogenase E2 component (dihydrolipoamide acetyltransferase)
MMLKGLSGLDIYKDNRNSMTLADVNQLPLTRIQKLIGRLMLQSKQTKASGYMTVRVDLTDLTQMRRDYCRKARVRATTNDFFILAMARAVRKYPLLAATLDEYRENLIVCPRIGVGFAVAAPQGLVVPVLQDMGHKSLIQAAAESEIMLNKARSNKLEPDDFDGANVVLTGLGMFGINQFYAIAPPSATAIISIGLSEEGLIVKDEEIRTRKMMDVSMAYDGQIIDEFYAAGYLREVADQLEDPWTLTR